MQTIAEISPAAAKFLLSFDEGSPKAPTRPKTGRKDVTEQKPQSPTPILYNVILMICACVILITMIVVCAFIAEHGGEHNVPMIIAVITAFTALFGNFVSHFKITKMLDENTAITRENNTAVKQVTNEVRDNMDKVDSALQNNEATEQRAVQAAKSVAAQAIIIAEVQSKEVADKTEAAIQAAATHAKEVALQVATEAKAIALKTADEARASNVELFKQIADIKTKAIELSEENAKIIAYNTKRIDTNIETIARQNDKLDKHHESFVAEVKKINNQLTAIGTDVKATPVKIEEKVVEEADSTVTEVNSNTASITAAQTKEIKTEIQHAVKDLINEAKDNRSS